MQHAVARIARFGDDAAAPVRAEHAPPDESALKIPVRDELNLSRTGRLHHAQVIDQTLACAEQAEDKLAPLRVGIRRHAGRRDRAVSVKAPAGLAGFIARGPRFALRVVGERIAQLQRRAVAIGVFGPAPAVAVMHFVRRIPHRVAQHQFVVRVREAAVEIAHDVEARILQAQRRRVLRDHEIRARREDFVGGKFVINAVAEIPAGEVHRVGAAIEEFNPRLVVRLRRRV